MGSIMGGFKPGAPARPNAMVNIRIGGTFLLAPFLGDLEDLIYELRENGNDGQITYRPPSGYGVTLYQTIMLYIELKAADAAIGDVTKQAVDSVINWVKGLFKRDREQAEAEGETVVWRKKIITIYGPDGKPLKRIKVDSEDEIEVTDPGEDS
jgi:hypothetical protein